MSPKVLVVDDDPDVRHALSEVLEANHYTMVLARDGLEGLQVFFKEHPDLVITDIEMGRMQGWELLGRIREVADTPVIVLTVLGKAVNKVRGLRGGADDYLAKPFGMDELLARCEVVLRRTTGSQSAIRDVYQDGVLEIDFKQHTVHLNGSLAELSPTEFHLLGALVNNVNIVLRHDQLLDMAWEEGQATLETLRVHISSLRQKISGCQPDATPIETVRGFGYRYRRTG